MKKIFILTGEPSGDNLASKAIKQLKKSRSDIEYLSVGGEHLKNLGVESIYDLNEVTYLGFTKVLLNIFKIKKKINETTNKIIEFNPDILFSVDSPDFTLRVAKKVKEANPKIKTIHYVAPQVWVWRPKRVKKIKMFIDHTLLLFNFEKKYFEKEKILSTFVGHPLLENKNRTDPLNIKKNKSNIVSIFPGSRLSEVKRLMPILCKFILKSKFNSENFNFFFHTTNELKKNVVDYTQKFNLNNCDVVSNAEKKNDILSNSVLAIAKSGTISLEICNLGIPSFIIYKMNFINFFIIKNLVNVKFANIINILANHEIIPELLQSKCTSNNIYNKFKLFINNPQLAEEQIFNYQKILREIKLKTSPSENVASILDSYLKGFNR